MFPPHLTLSTKILLDYIVELDLKNKAFLELGCGSGIISLLASKKGAFVTATDINNIALDHLKKASFENHLKVDVIDSDLFKNLKNKSFDYIIINPPYYPKKAKNVKEKAWFCGEDFEYFKGLFNQLPNFMTNHNQVNMILSEDCQIEIITSIASLNNLKLTSVYEISKMGETNNIFEINLK